MHNDECDWENGHVDPWHGDPGYSADQDWQEADRTDEDDRGRSSGGDEAHGDDHDWLANDSA